MADDVLTGADGVERRVVLVTCNREGCTYSRGPNGTHRVFVGGGPWGTLNPLQQNAVCKFVWPGALDYALVDAQTDELIATYP